MIIGMVSREYPPFFGGGVGTYVYQMSRAFAEAGHEIHVFTVRTEEDRVVADPPGVHVHRVPFAPLPVSRTNFTGQWFVANRWFHAAVLFRETLLEFVQERPLDIVEFPEWEAPGWPLLLDERWTTPSVATCHTPTWVLQAINDQPPLSGQLLEKLELALVDGVIAPCTPMARRVAAGVELAPPIRIVPHPFFAGEVSPDPRPPAGKKIVYAGRLELRKGVIDLIAAAKRVLAQDPEVEFYLIGGDTTTAPGGGSMREHLLPMLDAAQRERIHFVDNCPPDELYRYYRAARFCVFPSHFENFPNVCLEAMSAGRTAVVGNDSGMIEMIGDCGLAVPPHDPERLADTILGLLGDPARTVRLGQQAARRVREVYAPARMVAERLAAYQEVLARVGSRVTLAQRLARVSATVWREVAPEMAEALRLLLTTHPVAVTGQALDASAIVRRVRAKMPDHPGALRIALYGAGQHTLKLVPQFPWLASQGVCVALILDDAPERSGGSVGGVPVVRPTEALSAGVDCVVLSSDAMEPMLWDKSLPLRQQGLPVIRLYARQD